MNTRLRLRKKDRRRKRISFHTDTDVISTNSLITFAGLDRGIYIEAAAVNRWVPQTQHKACWGLA